MTPVARHDWKVYGSGKNSWKEIFNSDDKKYWGTGDYMNTEPRVELADKKEKVYEINLQLPPLGAVVLK